MSSGRTWDRRDWVLLAVVGAVAFAVFVGSLQHGFVYDDVHILVRRANLHSIGDWQRILVAPWWTSSLYRPVSQLSLALDWTVSDGNPHYFHLVNVLLHTVTTALVYVLARRWLSVVGAVVAALVFAVHPVHVEAVASVVGRTEVLATLFAVVAVLVYRKDGDLATAQDRSLKRAVTSFGTLVALVLAVGSKEIAFATPGLLLISDWMDAQRAGEPFPVRFKRHGVLWAATVALAVEFLLLRTVLLGDVAGDYAAPGLVGEGLIGRTLVMAPVFLEYVRLLVFPLHLSADYSVDFIEVSPSVTLVGTLGLATVAGLAALGWAKRRTLPVATLGLAWIGGSLFVVSNILVPTGVLVAERSFYLPSVGLALIGGWLAATAWPRQRAVTAVVTTIVIVAGAARTLTRVPVWQEEERFYRQLVYDAEGSFRSMWVGAMLLYEYGLEDEGERLIRQAIATYPLFPNLWQDFAKQLRREERWQESAGAFAIAFRLDSTRVFDAASAIEDYVKAGMRDSAQVLARAAARINPHHPDVLVALGDLALDAGHPLEAMTLRRQASWRIPSSLRYWYLTAQAALEAEYCPEASRSIRRLFELHPGLEEAEALDRRRREMGCES